MYIAIYNRRKLTELVQTNYPNGVNQKPTQYRIAITQMVKLKKISLFGQPKQHTHLTFFAIAASSCMIFNFFNYLFERNDHFPTLEWILCSHIEPYWILTFIQQNLADICWFIFNNRVFQYRPEFWYQRRWSAQITDPVLNCKVFLE